MRGERVRSARRLPPAKPTQGKTAATHPQRDNIFCKSPLSEIKLRDHPGSTREHDLSAHSELKTELADSRIETKLPINEAGLLHVCLIDVSWSHAGAEMPLMRNAVLRAAG